MKPDESGFTIVAVFHYVRLFKCLIGKVFGWVRLPNLIEVNRTIWVRLGSITERSIDYAGSGVLVDKRHFFKANNFNRYFEFCWPCRSLLAGELKHFHSLTLVSVCLFFFLNHLTISAPANRSCNRLKYFVVKHWRGVNEQHVRRFVKQIEVSLKHKRRPPSLPTWCPRCTKVQGEYLHLSRSWFCQWETF